MFRYFICIVFAFASFEASSQTISYVVDSVMNEYMQSGYANEHFMPSGKYDKYNLRDGKWKDYTVDETFTWYIDNSTPVAFSGYFLIYGEGKFEHDLREGTWELYLLEDKTFKKIHFRTLNYVHGKREGMRTDYYPSGKIAYQGNYANDLYDGEHTIYFENGNKFDAGYYSKGNSIGWNFSYYMDGTLKSKRFYSNDTVVGTSTFYYPSGKIEWTAEYKNGIGDGLYRYYYESGQLWTEKLFKEGKVMEVNGTYSMDGTKLDHGTITNGNGTVISYTLKGKVYNISTYENGVEVSEENFGEFE
jgi:antitoxin component YwqK of YwqJK toxin-antitoxin module